MALEPHDLADGPLARALDAARDEQPEGWVALSAAIKERVRATVTPAHPLLVRDLPDGSRTFVSTRVVTAALRVLLGQEATHAPSGIRLRLEGDRLVGVDLALVAAYGVDLVALADHVRADVLAELAGLTGVALLTPADVDIDVVDVVEGDPRVV